MVEFAEWGDIDLVRHLVCVLLPICPIDNYDPHYDRIVGDIICQCMLLISLQKVKQVFSKEGFTVVVAVIAAVYNHWSLGSDSDIIQQCFQNKQIAKQPDADKKWIYFHAGLTAIKWKYHQFELQEIPVRQIFKFEVDSVIIEMIKLGGNIMVTAFNYIARRVIGDFKINLHAVGKLSVCRKTREMYHSVMTTHKCRRMYKLSVVLPAACLNLVLCKTFRGVEKVTTAALLRFYKQNLNHQEAVTEDVFNFIMDGFKKFMEENESHFAELMHMTPDRAPSDSSAFSRASTASAGV